MMITINTIIMVIGLRIDMIKNALAFLHKDLALTKNALAFLPVALALLNNTPVLLQKPLV